jgi:UDP-N-acetylmuramoylalanine--D-glutamate ligase
MTTKIIGIYGFGIVGKSALQYGFSHQEKVSTALFGEVFTLQFVIADKRTLSNEEQALVTKSDATIFEQITANTVDTFFLQCDVVIVSPGIDISKQQDRFKSKIIHELDLFAVLFTKPTVAITGTIGKTSITQLITELLQQDSCKNFPNKTVCGHASGCVRVRSCAGGNIGYGMLTLLEHLENIDLAVLELSSFQLEGNTAFAPHIGVITNMHPNHLDRHKTMQAYFEAKWQLVAHQKKGDFAVLPIEFLELFSQELERVLPHLLSQVVFISKTPLTTQQKDCITRYKAIAYFVQQDDLYCFAGASRKLVSVSLLKPFGFLSNWMIALVVLDLLKKNLEWISDSLYQDSYHTMQKKIGAHRFEFCGTIAGVDFYNDSKATVVEATQSAINRCLVLNKPLILIIGGISKGVDRSPLLAFIKQQQGIKKVITFGDCKDLASVDHCHTLEEVIITVFKSMQAGDQVLFSPSGASFDLFKNYQHRGDCFKQLLEKQR